MTRLPFRRSSRYRWNKYSATGEYELYCRSCASAGDPDPWWANTDEFWSADPDGFARGDCKACRAEATAKRRMAA